MILQAMRALLVLALLVRATTAEDDDIGFLGEGTVEVGTVAYIRTLSPTENVAGLVPGRGVTKSPTSRPTLSPTEEDQGALDLLVLPGVDYSPPAPEPTPEPTTDAPSPAPQLVEIVAAGANAFQEVEAEPSGAGRMGRAAAWGAAAVGAIAVLP